MSVVSNTSPIRYLYQVNQIEVLPDLFGKIYIPRAVFYELQDIGAPPELQRWVMDHPKWLIIKEVFDQRHSQLDRLHPGEREAITLAKTISAELIILDDKAARETANICGLRTTGLLGILDQAAVRNMIDLKESIQKLIETNFRISPSVLSSLLSKHYGR